MQMHARVRRTRARRRARRVDSRACVLRAPMPLRTGKIMEGSTTSKSVRHAFLASKSRRVCQMTRTIRLRDHVHVRLGRKAASRVWSALPGRRLGQFSSPIPSSAPERLSQHGGACEKNSEKSKLGQKVSRLKIARKQQHFSFRRWPSAGVSSSPPARGWGARGRCSASHC